MRTALARALGCSLLLLPLAACTGDSSEPVTPPETTAPGTEGAEAVDLTFGVFGTPDEIAAYSAMAEHFDTVNDKALVSVVSWEGHDGLRNAVTDGEPLPDVFLVSRRDLSWYLENTLTRPVDTLLDERGVDFGDVYLRDALTAFSEDNRLQCMPYGVQPQVIFYNTSLVNFDRMARRGLEVPEDHQRWTFDQFAAAAAFSSRPGRGTKGVSITPSLSGLAPFVYSGGGQVFDDDEAPTSTAFSDDASRSALETTLELLRDPKLTLTEDDLAKGTPLEWFKNGKLGMLAGTRAMVPELRDVPGLGFDVMPMPTIDSQATVGEVTGLCIAREAESPATAADFLVYASSTPAVAEVAREGYLQPANQEVALSDDFLQSGDAPLSADVFNDSVTRMVVPPLLDVWDELAAAVEPYILQLFYAVPTLDLEAVTEEIDAASQPVLNPEAASESPSEDASGSPVPGVSDSSSPSP